MYFSKENKYEIFSNWNVIHFPWTHTFLDVFRKFYWLLLKSFKFNIKEFALSTFIEGFEIKIFEILGWYKNTNVSQFFWLSVINQDCWRVWLKSLWKRKQKSCWLNAFKVYWSVRNIDRYFEPDICFGLRTYKTTPSISKLSTLIYYFIKRQLLHAISISYLPWFSENNLILYISNQIHFDPFTNVEVQTVAITLTWPIQFSLSDDLKMKMFRIRPTREDWGK